MKINFKYIAYAAAGAAMLTAASCVNDLDTLPLNPTDKVTETVYGKDLSGYLQGLSKLYGNFSTNDTDNLQVADAGASELVRAFWNTQEVTCDAVKCAWANDAWVHELDTDTWSDANNDATYAVYVRTQQGISFVNEFLRQTTDDQLSSRGVSDDVRAQVHQFRAEARFMRAYFYWIALDTFGDVPFTTEESPVGGGFMPTQSPRADVFNYCVSELKDITTDGNAEVLPAPRSNYPRADQGSAYGLLARMYLNAGVYTGTPMWQEAKDACETIFGMGYALCPNYADLFRGDNGENPQAKQEMLFAVPYDSQQNQSNGGTSYMTMGAIATTDVPDDLNGLNNGWGGIRVPFAYVQDYFGVASGDDAGSTTDYTTGTYTVPNGDKRGQLFYIKGRVESMNVKDGLTTFLNGWSYLKYNNIPHDMDSQSFATQALTEAFSDIDFPLIRLGEIYLIYAEACMNLGSVASAMPYIQELEERAGVSAPTTIDQDWLVAERARELMWEGDRRTDLIRYGLFTSASYLWPFKGGDNFAGQKMKGDYMNLFAIPSSELIANPNLHQTPGYPDVR